MSNEFLVDDGMASPNTPHRRPAVSVRVFPDLEALSRGAAEFFTGASGASITAKGLFTAAISGGSTPGRLYQLLASDDYKNRIDWERVHVFWADERCVPKEHAESNFKLAFDTFLSKVAIPAGNIHRIRGEEGPEKGAGDYEAELKAFFGQSGPPVFDLILLGVGEDGHTASLFPGSPAIVRLDRVAFPVYRERPGLDRITLTLPVLNNASRVLFLVAGAGKASVVQTLLEDAEGATEYPAGLVRPLRGSVTWLIDQAAAQRLSLYSTTQIASPLP